MPTSQRIEIIRGNTGRFQVEIKDDSGSAVNLTGSSVFFTVRKKYSSGVDDSDAVFQKEVGDGITLSNPSAGLLSLVIPSSDTVNLAATSLLYDLEVVTSAGDVITPALGEFVIRAEVTRRKA